ncbi:group-specific protein [Bacillus clarus]|uniref:Group-specific protein n=1 Tax=Bacillus clarus TaxID=2338372 RepID=A0A090Z075_9BACI|nr:type I restriction-modification system subunit M N-terminal domain-containing protein [Bacillus clarus]KFN04027.1 hypothetical protein DJ93_140 [Bacillus clarus]RFT63583.1 group-specific protein [Bacillus clarus]
MNEIDRIMKCCNYDDELFRMYIVCLLQLKQCSEKFKKVRQELRTDYLIKGICEREIDGIIKGSKGYEKYYVPKVLQWDFLRRNPFIIEHICEELFAYKRINLSTETWIMVIACIENE